MWPRLYSQEGDGAACLGTGLLQGKSCWSALPTVSRALASVICSRTRPPARNKQMPGRCELGSLSLQTWSWGLPGWARLGTAFPERPPAASPTLGPWNGRPADALSLCLCITTQTATFQDNMFSLHHGGWKAAIQA